MHETSEFAQVSIGSPVCIRLRSLSGAGYLWEVRASDPELEIERLPSEPMGTPTSSLAHAEVFRISARRPGHYTVTLHQLRNWEPSSVRAVHHVHIDVAPR